MSGALYFGDNLDVLREHIRNESVDLIYLDPPFNSNVDYGVLFKSPDGGKSTSQIRAFEDTWFWSDPSERAFDEVMRSGRTEVANVLRALRQFLGENDMMAYLAMMTVRLIELHRVLKPTGALYLHCDPTASHYLRVVLDAIFGTECLRGEIIWKRTNARGTQGRWPRLHDTIIHFAKSNKYKHNPQLIDGDAAKVPHTLITGPDGLKYQTFELTGAGTRQGETGQPWRGFDPNGFGRHWGNLHARMDEWDSAGLIHWPKQGGFPRRRADRPFEASVRKVVLGDVWTDIDRLNQTAQERLGYPTQKPVALLERILAASSNPGDVVLDPFCGCGTTVHAAEKMDRRWLGIDITPLAVNLIARRLKDAFRTVAYEVRGIPKDMDGARELAARDKHLFQLWATDLIGAQPYRDGKKGADGGVDGLIYFKPDGRVTKAAIVSVKGGANVGVAQVRDLRGTIERLQEPMGVFVTLHPPTEPMRREAAAAGLYDSGFGKPTPRIQIVTIEDALKIGERAVQVPYGHNASFKQAPREQGTSQNVPDLFESGMTKVPMTRVRKRPDYPAASPSSSSRSSFLKS